MGRSAKRKLARKEKNRDEERLRRRKEEDSNNIIISENVRVKLHNEILEEMKSYNIFYCNTCTERNFKGDLNDFGQCEKCEKYIKKKQCFPPWSEALCPIRDIPEELLNLSSLERIMISLCFLECFIVKLGFQGQRVAENEICARGLKRNSIAFPMDLETLNRSEKVLSLPWSPAHLIGEDRIRVIVYKGPDEITQDEEAKLKKMYRKELTVRRSVVLKALRWKKEHCQLYQNIKINEDIIMELPEEKVYEEAIYEEATDPHVDNVNDSDEDLSSAFMDVPLDRDRNSNLWRQIGKALKYHVSPTPLSEFQWKDYFYKAFPILFPYGVELDSFDKLEDAVRHLLLHKDNRFREDCMFYFVAFSQLRRRKIVKSSKIQCGNKNMKNVLEELKTIGSQKWREIGKDLERGKSFCEIDSTVAKTLQNLTAVSGSLRNTWGNKKRQRNELRSMICKYGRPVLWFTICPSQQHNPLVLKLGDIPDSCVDSIKDRIKFCMNDPVASTEFFHLTVLNAIKVLQKEVGMDQYYAVVESQMRGVLHLHLIGWNTGHNLKTESEWIRFADKVCLASVSDTSLSEEEINELLQEFPNEVKSEYEIIENSKILCQSTKSNLHDYRHRKSCFKNTSGDRRGTCRYKFPKTLQENTCMRKDGIELKRNHAYINTYNPIIMNLFRCNHDIKILPNLVNDDLLALLYYLTNYTTKMESSNYSVCDVAATAREELLKELENPTARRYADRLFIRILNKITGKQEISSNLVVNELLGYAEEYCSQKFKTLNYGILLRALNGEEFDVQLRIPKKPSQVMAVEDMEEDYITDEIVVTNLYDDYINRGDELSFLSVYQYVSRVYKKKVESKDSVSRSCFRFVGDHPQRNTHVQVLLSEDSGKVPKLIGPATFKFTETEYMQLQLLLFKPWTDLEWIQNINFDNMDSFEDYVSIDSEENLRTMQNFRLLHKCKVAAEKKRFEQASQNGNDSEVQNNVSEDGELLKAGNGNSEEDIDSEDDNDNESAENIIDILENPRHVQSDRIYLNMIHNQVSSQDSRSSERIQNDKEFEENEVRLIQLQSEVLNKIDFQESEELQMVQIVDKVAEIYNLNREQKMALWMAQETLSTQCHFILCGEAGTGKSKCLEAMHGLFRVLGQGNNIVASGTTGVSSARLRCRTIHSLCGWRKQKSDMENANSPGIERLRRLLPRDLKLLLIDEVSMLDARMIYRIDDVFRKIFKRPNTKFGGVSVCFSGDFYQLPPVGGHSLLKDIKQRRKLDHLSLESLSGLEFWRSIENVIILQQNYRQQDNVYLQLLRNWKNGKMAKADWDLLRSRQLKHMTKIPRIEEKDIYCIVKFNDTRNALNRSVISNSEEKIYECFAEDTCSTANLEHVEQYLQELNDNRSNYFPGVVRFFIGAQVVLTHNYKPEIGVAKGTRGVVRSYNQEKDEIVIELMSGVTNEVGNQDTNVQQNMYVVKRVSTSFKLSGHVIRRRQFGLDLGYAVTDYKSQGESVSKAFIDISGGSYYSIYVMLSRVRRLNGLFLLNDFNPDKINPVVPDNLRVEMERLNSLFVETHNKFFL